MFAATDLLSVHVWCLNQKNALASPFGHYPEPREGVKARGADAERNVPLPEDGRSHAPNASGQACENRTYHKRIKMYVLLYASDKSFIKVHDELDTDAPAI